MRRALPAALAAALLLVSACSDDAAVPAPGPAQIDVDTPQLRELKAEAGIEPCAPGAGEPVEGGLPEVTLECLGGGDAVDLSTLRGPLVLNIWGEWCGPCREELPAVAEFYERYGDRVGVVGIDYQDLRPGPAIDLARRSGATYPQLADTQGALQAQDPIPPRVPVPSFLLVDEDGTATLVPGGIETPDELVDLANEHLGTDL